MPTPPVVGLFRTSFDENHARMAFNEGRKSVAYGIVEDIEIARPGTFYQIFNEFNSNATKEKQ